MPPCFWAPCCGRRASSTTGATAGARRRFSWRRGRPCWRPRSFCPWLLLYAGIPGTALAYWAAAVSSSELPASTTSLGLLAAPAISIIVALFLLGEQPTLILMLAPTLILIGMAVGMSGPTAGAPRR